MDRGSGRKFHDAGGDGQAGGDGCLCSVRSFVYGCVHLVRYEMYRAFDYNGKRQMSKQIIEGIAEYVDLPEGGSCLDVGCGSGALGIAIAK